MSNVIILSSTIGFCWGIVPIMYKLILSSISGKSFFSLYYIIAVSFVLIYTIYNWNNISLSIDKLNGKLTILLISAVLISVIATYLYYCTLESYNVYIVTILTAIAPLFTILIAYFYLGEKISILSWIGIILVIIGVILIVYESQIE